VWGREVNGLTLTFHLAGINNQNFLMRDEETGTYWQQISGKAISGPLAGKTLPFVRSDELSFGLWKAERPDGSVLQDVAAYASQYSAKDWDVQMRTVPTVLSYAQPGLGPRDIMVGVRASGAARAFPYDAVKQAKLIQDRLGAEPVLLVLGPDGQSVRAFRARIPGAGGAVDFYRTSDEGAAAGPGPQTPVMMDSASGSSWNFQGCAIEGKAKGTCLESIQLVKDYWFDWRHYNPDTTVYGRTR
jgi:hypothetical protein